jgi:hypothetical protein
LRVGAGGEVLGIANQGRSGGWVGDRYFGGGGEQDAGFGWAVSQVFQVSFE